jgi:hypothetical protein
MENFDLLRYVQPEDGFICVIGIDDPVVKQRLVSTYEEAYALAEKFVAKKLNVFFAVARFKTPDNRKKENVQTIKSFWLDIDCGPNKAEPDPTTGLPAGYIDQATGLRTLLGFCDTVGLPIPTIVNSGRGLHVYWVLDRAIAPNEWEPVAARLRDVCRTQQLYVDANVFETARVLRVPGTFNFKDETPKPVKVLKTAAPVPFEEFCAVLGVDLTVERAPTTPRRVSMLGKMLSENIESSFAKIMVRSAKGDGCQQLLDCYTQRDSLPEPRWFDALSIAKFCSDADTAVHRMSAGHPGYDPVEVDKKLAHIVGPHTCEVMERNNPGVCQNCPHFGKVKSPIVLGREILRHEEGAPIPEPAEGESEEEPDDVDSALTPAPRYTEPYFRGKNGGVYIQLGEDEPKLVYEHDFYVVKRLSDPILGDVALFRLHTPRDGVREFVVPNIKISQMVELRKELAKNGVMASDGQFKLITGYVIHALRELQYKRKAEIMRRQFGWADGDTKFIVGDREITRDGVYHSPPSSITESMVPYFEPRGTLEAWKEVFALYGQEGMEVQAFAALSGFGSALFKFTGQKGAIINLIHPFAGTGKTTVLRMANSICGHPEDLLGNSEDTKVARITKVGILNNIVNSVDEITNLDPKMFSDLAYAYSQGKGKDKGDAQENKLRINNTTWRTLTLTSSNSSFYDKVASLKAVADGEIMRLLEFKVDYTTTSLISTEHGKLMFDHQLNENYGHAIVPFVQYVISNMEEVRATLTRVQGKIDRELKLTSRERNWSAIAAANITAGLIAYRLGLLVGWDMARIYAVVTAKLQEMRYATKAPVSNAIAIIGDYIYRHINNVLVVDDLVDNRTHLPKAPLVEPRGELLIRFEPDTKRMYIAVNAFRRDCVTYQTDYTETTKELKEKGILMDTVNKRLSKGMSMVSSGVRCLVLNCDNSEFFDVSSMLPTEPKDAGGESSVRD